MVLKHPGKGRGYGPRLEPHERRDARRRLTNQPRLRRRATKVVTSDPDDLVRLDLSASLFGSERAAQRSWYTARVALPRHHYERPDETAVAE